MSTAVSTPERGGTGRRLLNGRSVPPWTEKALVPLFIVVVAVLPLFFSTGNAFIGDCVLALAYTVMALGLNIIVGFAGLLDLGYVAFFAIGAYTIGWLGSGFFAFVNHQKGVHVLVGGQAAVLIPRPSSARRAARMA